jgi:hypothetical protein
VSPILVRPVREQFEHDRVIRVLQARYKRKYDEVVINPGAEQNASVTVGENPMHPDLVLYGLDRGRRVLGTVEVETGESVNTLEAMAEWGPFSRLRGAFHLYVPPNSLDTVRRLCAEYQIVATEIWTYHTAADQVRFTMVHREPESPPVKTTRPVEKVDAKPAAPKAALKPEVKKAAATKAPAKPIAAARPTAAAKKAAKPAKPAAKAAKPVKAVKKAAAKAPAKAAKRR